IRDQFLSIAAHELKTPVTGLLGFSELAMMEIAKLDRGEQLAHAVQVINQQSNKLSALVSQLLDLSRLESGKVSLNRTLVDLAQIASEVCRSAQTTTAKHVLTATAPGSVLAMVDPVRIEQVLTNLLDNAIKFSPDGGEI